MENSLSIYGINGPLVTVKGKTDLKMSEMVYVGKEKLVGEVIRLSPELATIQVFEETSGLKPGELLYPRLPDCIRENLWKVRERQCRLRWHPVS